MAKIKIYFKFSDIFPENCVIYEVMWKNMVEPAIHG